VATGGWKSRAVAGRRKEGACWSVASTDGEATSDDDAAEASTVGDATGAAEAEVPAGRLDALRVARVDDLSGVDAGNAMSSTVRTTRRLDPVDRPAVTF
jgi:hypothetical protein